MLVVTAAWLYAGPLNPPAGPITSTGKTLTEVEPRIAINATNTPGDNDATPSVYKITQSGSYYLTGNISLVNAKSAIEIATGGVTLDLNGFTISGFGGVTGIFVTNAAADHINIRNGRVVNFLSGGVVADVSDVTVDRIAVQTCGAVGIRAGMRAQITHCSAVDCHTNAPGINAGSSSIVHDCIANGNSLGGISVGSSSVVRNCTATFNTGTGINPATASTVADCTASNNTASGVGAGNGSMVSHCSVQSNGGNGVSADTGVTVSNCSVFYNTATGISAYTACIVADNAVHGNTLDGIFVLNNCTVRGNSCTTNGNGGDGAGIRTSSGDNRIEGNRCTGADRGIDVDGPRNIIIKNTCSGNTVNWTIVAGNSFLIVQANVTASNFSGNAGGGGQGTTDPNANFTY